jgi:hypothetical protein
MTYDRAAVIEREKVHSLVYDSREVEFAVPVHFGNHELSFISTMSNCNHKQFSLLLAVGIVLINPSFSPFSPPHTRSM